MCRVACLAVVLVLELALLTSGAEPAPKPAPSLDQLIQQLGNRDYRVRQEAARALLARGGAVLPDLRKARSYPDAEIQQRLDELIATLERLVAVSPKLITLHLEKKPVREVVAALAKQTGFKMQVDGPTNTPQAKKVYSFQFDKVPFWTALNKVCVDSGLLLQQGGDDTLRLTFQDSYEPYISYDGAFKVLATGFQYQRNTNFGEVPKTPYQPGALSSESLMVSLTIAVEPRVPILKVGQVKLTCAEDDARCSMLGAGGDNPYGWWGPRYYYGGFQRTYVQQTWAGLAWPTKTSKTVKVLKGVIPVTLLAEERPMVVTDKLLASKGKKFKIGNATFAIDDVQTQPNKRYAIKISYSEDGGNNYDYSQINSLQQRVQLQDDKGNKYPTSVQIYSWNSPTSAQFNVSGQQGNNSKLGPPTKLVFQHWVQMEHEVAFEFKDLPLP